MASGCKSAVGCVDSQMPVRATYVNLYKWPESDANFVRSVMRGPRVGHRKFGGAVGPAVVDSYSCRQMYLRSYTFSKKESVPEKTVRCFGKVKERAAAVLIRERVDSVRNGKSSSKRKKKRCATVKMLKERSCSAIRSIFRRLLACTSTVDVVDCGSPESIFVLSSEFCIIMCRDWRSLYV